jgi:hypothetical protein
MSRGTKWAVAESPRAPRRLALPTAVCSLHVGPVSARRDSDQLVRVGVGTRLGSTQRAGGTRRFESGVS